LPHLLHGDGAHGRGVSAGHQRRQPSGLGPGARSASAGRGAGGAHGSQHHVLMSARTGRRGRDPMTKASSSDGGTVSSRAAAATPLADSPKPWVAARRRRPGRSATPVGPLGAAALMLLMLLASAGPARAHIDPETGLPLPDRASIGKGTSAPEAIPDIFGPGPVLNV